MTKTVTRADITMAATGKTGLAKNDVVAVAQQMFELIGTALKEGQTVKLTGFGTLQVRSRAERVGRNPRTGTEHRVTPRQTVIFTPSAKLRDALDELIRN